MKWIIRHRDRVIAVILGLVISFGFWMTYFSGWGGK